MCLCLWMCACIYVCSYPNLHQNYTDPILFECHTCKKASATSICSICKSESSIKQASLCDNCLKLYECGEDMALPIVNSPRSGECGYTG